eukprot:TRINITY_DN3259_c0_g1_i3.p1 TRINITY_DN3259_c0_g1~~TRINITY_DN3259_c0_g1_i3.p1  ORF type:complete len:338 (-),score=8.63 TRINITY_DN3259_c0_g1_i3:116-1129(-)
MDIVRLLKGEFSVPHVSVNGLEGIDEVQDGSAQEKGSIMRMLLAFAIFLVGGAVNTYMANLADRLRPLPGTPPLPDIGHYLIPEILHPEGLPEYFLGPILMTTFAFVLIHPQRLCILRRIFVIQGVMSLLRALTVVVTSLPDPNPLCQDVDRTMRHVFQPINPFDSQTCGDLIFSGHTVALILAGFIWQDYTRHRGIHVVVWALVWTAVLSLLAARFHYTIDVVIASILTIRIWRHYHLFIVVPELQKEDWFMQLLEDQTQNNPMAILEGSMKASLSRKTRRMAKSFHNVQDAISNHDEPYQASGLPIPNTDSDANENDGLLEGDFDSRAATPLENS